MMQPLKVFISSTYLDLIDYRQVAITVANRYKCAPLAMEFFLAQPAEPSRVAEKEVRDCDIFVGLYAHRFGFVPPGQAKSITQQEYELARQLKKDCLCFVVQKGFAWNPELIEFEKHAPLQAFLTTVQKENTVAYFTTTVDFESKLSASLGKLLLEKTSTGNQSQRSGDSAFAGQRFIPRAPTPFIAHPYPLPPHFTGREAEKALLSNWLHNAPEPMLVLEAIGGMGKTSLTWVWLQQEVLAKNAELDGVLWWSFYDEPFETFVQSLFFYLTSKEVKVERGTLSDQLSFLHSILYNNRFLLILDGFERALRGYSGMKAMFIQEPLPSTGSGQAVRGPFDSAQGDNHTRRSHAERSRSITADEERERRLREPVHPQAGQFLKRLATGKCKTLLTTRLFPAALEEVAGVRHERLAGLSPSDSVRFFRSEGLIGSRAEMERAAAVYGNHPLMLKLLSTALRRKRAKDMAAAFKLNLIDQKEPQKILATSFNLLNKKARQVATTVSVFRGSFDFGTAKALFPRMQADQLWELLQGLQQLGFLFYDEARQQFDFHPILRSFLYNHLTTQDTVHQRAVVYFQALPEPKKVVTLADLAPMIELYYHLVGAGKFEEAIGFYCHKLWIPIFYQLANYNLEIELLCALFPEGKARPSYLQDKAWQAWTLGALANSYSFSGQPVKARPLYLMHNKLREKSRDKKNLAIGLGAMAKSYIGQLSCASAHIRKRIALCREIQDTFEEAVGHQDLGYILLYQGRWQQGQQIYRTAISKAGIIKSELAKSFEIYKKENNIEWMGKVLADCALSFLLQTRFPCSKQNAKKNAASFAIQTFLLARLALTFAKKDSEIVSPVSRDFVRAYWLLGEALLQFLTASASLREQKLDIHFYDEPFQQITETLRLQKDNALHVAERCLNEALRRCRSVNLVEMEPNLLVAWARLVNQKANSKRQKEKGNEAETDFKQIEEHVKEAREIAERAGYRLALADIHLFCAEVGLEMRENVETGRRPVSTGATNSTYSQPLLGLSIAQHLHKAKEYALDVSEYAHLYQSPDPHFYDGIPEAAMLKRGMTQQERIDNGYWVAYQIALALEQRLA